jgi:hypothetical protein
VKSAVLIVCLLLPNAAFAQVFSSSRHVFPWFLDGHTASGETYKTDLMLSNPNAAITRCTLQFAGFTARLDGLNGALPTAVSVATFDIFQFGYEVIRSLAGQNLARGYAVLNCTAPIYATATLSYFESETSKSPVVEASLPSSFGATSIEYVFDRRNGARLGIAVANPFGTPTAFRLSVGGTLNGTWTFLVPAGGVFAAFLDELVPLPANATGKVILSDANGARPIYSIASKYRGSTFSSVLPNIRVP